MEISKDKSKNIARHFADYIDSTPIIIPTALKVDYSPPALIESFSPSYDYSSDSYVLEIRPVSAEWLHRIRSRIINSITPIGMIYENNGQWLKQEIADTANDFFDKTSDVLPAEPFIYSSRKGSLVAEYKSDFGTMTNIISQDKVVIFTVIDNDIIEKSFPLKSDKYASIRKDLLSLVNALNRGNHGEKVAAK
ncbi:MAG: hypothetical protein JAZ15_14725 [Candidatus Thiodiazotropha endolucinida]|nr:hypothetical protein [Candidatus Thiodiazotropha taylori]MCW4314277.1 hypothetical protein [Candidatus Thiodiazotropha taylori]